MSWLWMLAALWVTPYSLMSQTQPPAEASTAKPDQLTAQSPQASGAPVKVFLTVSGDRHSSAVPTLSAPIVSVDKQPARVISFHPAKNDKLLFALLVDVSGSDFEKVGEIKAVALQLFQELSTDGNDGFLATFNDQIMMSKSPLQLSQVQTALDAVEFGRGTALYDAVAMTCRQTLSRSANPGIDRRALILLSDGDDNFSGTAKMVAQHIAQEEGITVFSLIIKSDNREGKANLNELSRSTGGFAISPKCKLSDGVPALINAVREQWAMTLLPQQAPDQKLHPLSLKSSQKGVHLSAPAQILLQ